MNAPYTPAIGDYVQCRMLSGPKLTGRITTLDTEPHVAVICINGQVFGFSWWELQPCAPPVPQAEEP